MSFTFPDWLIKEHCNSDRHLEVRVADVRLINTATSALEGDFYFLDLLINARRRTVKRHSQLD